ncbi:hypothetical protein [Streptomyces sp. NPDC048266]|uniref:hypothetical protein n=1 Tax=unclassified Streptomyces TaxID=2593676 RepID=UPI0033DD82D5
MQLGEPGAVERALGFMRRAATEKRTHRAVRLVPGESLLLRNDRPAHDRTRYEDEPDAPRLLVRALYRGVPHEGRPDSGRRRVRTASAGSRPSRPSVG